jgi:hypothetical protein
LLVPLLFCYFSNLKYYVYGQLHTLFFLPSLHSFVSIFTRFLTFVVVIVKKVAGRNKYSSTIGLIDLSYTATLKITKLCNTGKKRIVYNWSMALKTEWIITVGLAFLKEKNMYIGSCLSVLPLWWVNRISFCQEFCC